MLNVSLAILFTVVMLTTVGSLEFPNDTLIDIHKEEGFYHPDFENDLHRSRKRRGAPAFGTFKNKEFNSFRYGFPSGSRYWEPQGFIKEHNKPAEQYLREILTSKCNEFSSPGCGWFWYVDTKNKHIHGIDTESLAITYIYNVCVLKKGQDRRCPRPCARDPCRDKSHVTTNKCTQVEQGLFADNVLCQCKTTYEWDATHLECRRLDICKTRTLNPCRQANTELCKLTSESYECQCKLPFMGLTCNKQRDPCVANYDSNKPHGHKACGIHGKCKPIIGTNIYSCTCKKGYTDDEKNDWPDCGKQLGICESMLCFNGHCRASQDQKHAKCVCDEGFGGKDCSEEVPFWNSWRPWGACEPSCGNPRNRKRQRTCNERGSMCKGDKEEFQLCAPTICKADGEWDEWSQWTECDAKCDGGQQARTRTCYYDTEFGEAGWGKPCRGQSSQTQSCNKESCKQDSPAPANSQLVVQAAADAANTDPQGWKRWSQWSTCNEQCGTGELRRTRMCSHGPDQCPGKSVEVRQCAGACRPGQIPWREWSSWSFCKRDSRHCTRQRTCPRGAGGRCFGQSSQVAACAAGICQGKGRQSTQSVRSHFGAKAAKAYGNSGLNYGAAAGSKMLKALDKDGESDEDGMEGAEEEEGSSGGLIALIVVSVIAVVVVAIVIYCRFFRKKKESGDSDSYSTKKRSKKSTSAADDDW